MVSLKKGILLQISIFFEKKERLLSTATMLNSHLVKLLLDSTFQSKWC